VEVQQHLKVDRRSSVPLETQIARQLTQLIASDAIRVGDRLPPIRDLAGKLGVNLHTVRTGYRTLANQGLGEMRQGRGTTVAARTLAGFAAGRDDHRSFTMGVILPAMVSFYGPVLAGMEEAAAGDDQAGNGSAEDSTSDADDTVVDADFEEVDDDRKGRSA